MAMMLDCRMDRGDGGVVIALPDHAVERAYMLLDALLCGALKRFAFRSGSATLLCSCGDADALTREELILSAAAVEYVKSVLLSAALRPQDAAWLHADVVSEGGDVLIRIAANA